MPFSNRNFVTNNQKKCKHQPRKRKQKTVGETENCGKVQRFPKINGNESARQMFSLIETVIKAKLGV